MQTGDVQIDAARVERVVKDFLGEKTEFNLNRYLGNTSLSDFMEMNITQRRLFIDVLVDKVILPSSSSGRTSLARAELMSVLKVGVEPWRITQNYVPSPREHLLAEEMRGEFRKLKHLAISRGITKYDLKNKPLVDQKTRQDILDSAVGEIFGTMPKKSIEYSRDLFNKNQFEAVVRRSLEAYMGPIEAQDAGKSLMQLADIILKTGQKEDDQSWQFNEAVVSKNVMNYFSDTNQLLIRRLKNEQMIDDRKPIPDNKKDRVMHGIMSHYFGDMSRRFLEKEYEKMGLAEDAVSADKMALINAIIYDCMHASMTKEHAEQAQSELNKLIGGQ